MHGKSFCLGALLASAAFAFSGAAMAQTVDRDNEVIVNPVITSGRNTTLLYPGGQYVRELPPLLEPGETAKDMGPIHLHMPTHRQEAREAQRSEQPAAPRPKKQ